MKENIILYMDNVCVSYGNQYILKSINLNIFDGEIICIMGQNGSGKSTLLKTIFGLANIKKGKIYLSGNGIIPCPEKMILSGVSYVPQGRQLFPNLSVKENLEMGGFLIKDKKIIKKRINDVIKIFPDLKNKINNYAKNLSGGQQQMVAIGRALVLNPKILLLDEPTLGLSPKFVKKIIKKILEINKKNKTSIIIVEHNIQSILKICDRVCILENGHIVFNDSAKKITKDFLNKLISK